MAEQVYLVHSAVRKLSTRLKRVTAPTRHKFVQRLAGGTIIVRRVRPARITEEVLNKNLEELKQAVDEGRIEVRTMTGQVVDLNTLKASPLPATKPLPDPVKAEKPPPSINMPLYPEGKGQLEEVVAPMATEPDVPEGLEMDQESSGRKKKGKKNT